MKHHALILQRRRWHILKRSQTDLQTLYVKLPMNLQIRHIHHEHANQKSEHIHHEQLLTYKIQRTTLILHTTRHPLYYEWITNLNWRNFLQIYGVITPLKPGSWSPSFFLRCCNGLSGDLRGSENWWKLMRMYTISNSIEVCQPSFFFTNKIWVFPKIEVHQNRWFIMENWWFGGTIIFGNTHIPKGCCCFFVSKQFVWGIWNHRLDLKFQKGWNSWWQDPRGTAALQ